VQRKGGIRLAEGARRSARGAVDRLRTGGAWGKCGTIAMPGPPPSWSKTDADRSKKREAESAKEIRNSDAA